MIRKHHISPEKKCAWLHGADSDLMVFAARKADLPGQFAGTRVSFDHVEFRIADTELTSR